MNIEKGEYFVVTRGVELHKMPSLSLFPFDMGESWKQNRDVDEKPRYDRSYVEKVFQALEVCGDHVAARCVFGDKGGEYGLLNKTISLNLTELEIWPVTKEYIEALRGKKK